jgi:hypothetical protein
MSEIRVFLQQLDDAWGHAWESLQSVLGGVTEEEAFWQAEAYAGEAPEAGWPKPGTIAWHVAHVAHYKRYYTDIIRPAGQEGRPEVRPWTPRPDLRSLRGALQDAHEAQRAAIADFPDDRLDVVAGNDMPFREFLAMCIRHDTWHASQIAVARRLYRASHPAPKAPESS